MVGRSHPKECGLHAGNMKSIDIKTTGKSVVFYVMFRTQSHIFSTLNAIYLILRFYNSNKSSYKGFLENA